MLTEVGRLTSYIGKKKSAEDGKYDAVAVKESDNTMLGQFWNEGSDAIVNELKSFRCSFSSEENNSEGKLIEGLFASCAMPDYWNDELTDKVNKTCESFMINYIVSQWLMFAMSYDDANQYDKVANRNLTFLVEYLNTINRPPYGR